MKNVPIKNMEMCFFSKNIGKSGCRKSYPVDGSYRTFQKQVIGDIPEETRLFEVKQKVNDYGRVACCGYNI